ncbi:hypothetical protein MTO96_000171 [Rhipicephalus appendiculatus]
MSIPGLQPPPPFLPSPGHPAVPYGTSGSRPFRRTWWLPEHQIFQRNAEKRSCSPVLAWRGSGFFLYTEASGLAVWLCYRYWCQPFEYK